MKSILSTIVIVIIATLTVIFLHDSSVLAANTNNNNNVVPEGLYCGGNKSGDVKTLLQIHGNIASVLFSLPPTSSNNNNNNNLLGNACEVQFIISHLAMNNQQGSLPWTLYNTISQSEDTDYCQGLQVSASAGLQYQKSSKSGQDILLLLVSFTYQNQAADVAMMYGGGACDKAGYSISPWIPSGPYCTSISSSVGLDLGANNQFEVDVAGYSIEGRLVVSSTTTGQLKILMFEEDMTSLFNVALYNSTTGVIRIEGSFQDYNFNVLGSQGACARPDPTTSNANMVPNGTYCGSDSTDFVGLTLTEGHLFILHVGGSCTAQGIYTETVNSQTQQQPQINFFFSADFDCIQNVSVVSAVGVSSSSSSSSSSTSYNQITFTFAGANENSNSRTLNLKLNDCAGIPGNIIPQNDVVPNGLYCISPDAMNSASSANIDTSVLPGGTLGVAIFGTSGTNQKQQYQIWAGACEIHGWFDLDGLTGSITLHEHFQSEGCGSASSQQVQIAGVSYSFYNRELRLDLSYQGQVIRISATQGYCPLNTPSSVINSLPTGLYCGASSSTSSNNYPYITVLGKTIDFSFSDTCIAHGFYQVHTSGQVNVSITSIESCPGGMFLHTVTYVPPTPVTAASFKVLGFVNNQSVSFTAKNCSASSTPAPPVPKSSNLCFQVADSSQNLHLGYLLLTKTEARFTLGPCVLSATYNTDSENLVQNFAVTSSTSECSGVTMNMVSFSTDGSNTVKIQVKTSSDSTQQQITASSNVCPVVAPTTTTAIATTSTAAPIVGTTSTTTPVTQQQTTTSVVAPTTTTSSGNVVATTSTTTAAPSGVPPPPTSTSTSTTTSSTTTTTTTTLPPPTTTLVPTIPVGVYKFTTGETSNSLTGSLSVSPTAVVLEVGSCSEDGSLVQQQSNADNYDFVASSSSSGCSSTTVGSVTVSKKAAASSDPSSGGSQQPQQITVSGSVNGQSFSAAAQEQQNTANPGSSGAPSSSGSSMGGPIAGAVIGGVVVIAAVAYLYMRKKNSSGGTGTTHSTQFSDYRQQNQNHVNEEMLTSAVSQYNNYDERCSTQGQNDAGGLDI